MKGTGADENEHGEPDQYVCKTDIYESILAYWRYISIGAHDRR